MKEVTFHLEVFDGPLDLLLHLLSKNKVEIQDIPIAEILEQYLSYIRQMQEFDLEVASEFITMAAQLMYIKSKMLLPVYAEEPQEDPRAGLVEALLEYQRIREAGSALNLRSQIGSELFVKGQEPLEKCKADVQYSYDSEVLVRALESILSRAERRLPPPVSNFAGIVGTEPYPVTQKAKQVISRLISHGVMRFLALFKGSRSRSEIVATFLAVLELCRLRSVSVGEDENGEPSVTYLKTPDADVQTDIS